VSDSGEGRWTSIAAIDEGVPAPMLTGALYSRFASRNLDDFAERPSPPCAKASAPPRETSLKWRHCRGRAFRSRLTMFSLIPELLS
jgi:hypothetical protein